MGAIPQERFRKILRRFVQRSSRIRFIIYLWDTAASSMAIALAYEAVGVDGVMPAIFAHRPPTSRPSFSVEAEFERIVRARKL